jgi:hypothetical protein
LAQQISFLHNLQLRDPINFAKASVVIRDEGTSEIAAIMCYDNTVLSEVSLQALIITQKNGEDQFIPTISCLWEPLAYPLFFPSGTPGWGLINISNNNAGQYDNRNFEAATTQMWLYQAHLLRKPCFRYLEDL